MQNVQLYSPSITETPLRPRALWTIIAHPLGQTKSTDDELNDDKEREQKEKNDRGRVIGGEIAPFVPLGGCRAYLHVTDDCRNGR